MEIHYTAEFKRNLRHLMKKYPTIRSDLEPLLLNLQSGEICGDLVQHIGYQVYKVRLPNRDINPQQIKKIIKTFDVSS